MMLIDILNIVMKGIIMQKTIDKTEKKILISLIGTILGLGVTFTYDVGWPSLTILAFTYISISYLIIKKFIK